HIRWRGPPKGHITRSERRCTAPGAGSRLRHATRGHRRPDSREPAGVATSAAGHPLQPGLTMTVDELLSTLQHLETELRLESTRRDASRMAALLHPDAVGSGRWGEAGPGRYERSP